MKRLATTFAFLILATLGRGEIVAKYDIEKPDGSAYAEIKYYDDGTIKITYDGKELKGNRNGDKRKYKSPDKTELYEVKYSDAGFKLRTPTSALLRKVGRSDGKIKISDNEENKDPFEIKWKSDDRANLVFWNETRAEVKRYPDTGKLKVKSAANQELFVCKSAVFQPGFGALAIDAMPEIERLIVFAELAAP